MRATILELGRCARLCDSSFATVLAQLDEASPKRVRVLNRNEHSIDEIKTSVRGYLAELSVKNLSRRQTLLARSLNRCAAELERIGDHVKRIGDLVADGRGKPLDWMATDVSADVRALAGLSGQVVRKVAASFQSTDFDSEDVSWEVLDARNKYLRDSTGFVNAISRKLSRNGLPARAALEFSEFSVALDRIVRHCGIIAQEQRHEFFTIDRSRLGQGPVDAEN